ncbi:unnamed protein product, partial [Ascophyllum nodosum]
MFDKVAVEVIENDRHSSFDSHVFRFDVIKVLEIFPTTGSIRGGTMLSIFGRGFPASSELFVRFGPTEVQAIFMNSSHLQCFSPPAIVFNGEPFQHVSVVHDGVISGDLPFKYVPTTYLAFIEPTWGFVEHETFIALHGMGFINSTGMACSFESASGVAYSEMIFISTTTASCNVPSEMIVGKYCVKLRINGQDFTEDHATFVVLKEPSIVSISPGDGPNWGGTAVHVQGFDFERNPGFKCLFGSIMVSARWDSRTSLWCTSPAGRSGDRVRLRFTLDGRLYASAFLWFRYWDETTALRSSSNCAFVSGCRSTQAQDPPEFFGAIYSIHGGGGGCGSTGRSMFRSRKPSVIRIVPDRGPSGGGTTVFVSGTDFVDSDEIDCTFGSSVVAGRWISPVMVTCVTPEKADWQVVPFGMNLHGVTTKGHKSPVNFTFWECPRVHALHPHSGPRTGGTMISVRGNGFIFSSSLWARFGDTLVSVVYVSSKELRCTSPPF